MQRAFAEHLAASVVAAWAAAIPTISLQALWARGDVAPVYAIARALSPARRPAELAWYAWLDPDPTAPRVARAAAEALRAAQDDRARLAVLALVPLAEHPEVARVARRVAGPVGQVALRVRTTSAPPELSEVGGASDPIVWTLHAASLAEQGRREEAAAALASALAGPTYEPMIGRAMIPAIRRLDAWSEVPESGWDASVGQWAAFVAAQVGEGAVERLVARRKDSSLYVSASLAAGGPADAWRARLAVSDEARLEELYMEGLITREDQWTVRVGAALCGPRAYEEVGGFVLASLVEARAAADGFAQSLAVRAAGGPRDGAAIARRGSRLEAAVAASVDEERISWRTLRRFLHPSRALAELGGAVEVRAAVDALEQRWGPASTWGRSREWDCTSTIHAAVELLACAAGRALEALHLLASEPAPAPVRARICVGLARDGQVEALRAPLEALLAGPLEPAEVALLVPAVLALEPGGREMLERALERALASLPATPDAARRWLERCDLEGRRSDRRGR